ncbi:heme biosynthesis protein HemY [Sulfurirhabdus autotrophica]|uniref:HemY protein n=1 Tax=Sulfurirhabdus autotrophica TaxID=1706046 RepID=A0A4R3Y783_9PROT|nr:heme biosynthesis protein HemY [Sulfurirhabdus autotrophica]TCV86384.1 HemY protein [Sulfurirhabdus autotrophica]
MRGLFWILAVFGLAVAFTLAGKNTSSYVLLVYPPYRIELALNLMIALLLGIFFLGYILIRLATHTLRLPAYVRSFRLERRHKKARKITDNALLAFFEGRYEKAEKLASKAMEMQESPAITATLAARAAHEQRAFNRRDEYLMRAERLAPDESLVRLMTQADLLIDQRAFPEAMDSLKQLSVLAPKHLSAMRLELKAQQQAKNWEQVLTLVTQLEKRGAIESTQAEQLKINAYLENLKRKAQDDDKTLKAYWLKIPSAIRANTKVTFTAAQQFIKIGDDQTALSMIETSLEQQWDSNLIKLYGTCHSKDILKQLERAEKWLSTHPKDAALLLTLGKLCMRQELWGKSQSYLEASLSVEPTSETHIAFAQLLEKMKRENDACGHYRKSLELTLQQNSLPG